MNKVAIYGGLGNQMFQYSLYLFLNKKGIKTDVSLSDFLFDYHHNGFNLHRAFTLKLTSKSELISFFLLNTEFSYKNKVVYALLRRIIPLYKKISYNIYSEKKEFHYDSSLLAYKSLYLKGTWQSTIYLNDIKKEIQEEFTFKEPKDNRNKLLVSKIKDCTSVSIHIRRGDYQKPEWINTHAVIKEITYYKNAVRYITERLKNPHFFIFSDDINWAKANLKLSECTYIEHNKGKNSYIDMYLMSLCKHNIIANSTFSWWGAWLNKNEDKIVIMPDKWLINTNCPEIFPDGWIKLSP